MPGRVTVSRAPLPEGDPRQWLAREARSQASADLPLVVVGATTADRLVAADLPEPLFGEVEGALRARSDVRWTAAWGTCVLRRNGLPMLVTFARVRWPDDRYFAVVWPRLPGMPAESAERFEGPLADLPGWLAPLFPDLGGADIELVELSTDPWPGLPDPGPPDFVLTVAGEAVYDDVVRLAALRLETRFVTEGRADPAIVAWHGDTLSGWWAPGADGARRLRELGKRLARHPDTLAVGIFGLGEDEIEGERVPMIALAMERPSGDPVLWLRRFRRMPNNAAKWVDSGGRIRRPGPSLRWFGQG